ncbi:MAG TPA: LOG family protein, partial [Candidimonas sp.]|nr:LOG family protein [Candidimonas sp.]
ELFEVMTLVQTRKVPPAPIILVGSTFWAGLIDWIKANLLTNKLIGPTDLDLLTITDDPDVVMQHIQAFCTDFADQLDYAPALPE